MSQDNKLNDKNELNKGNIEERKKERKRKIKAGEIKLKFKDEDAKEQNGLVEVIEVESYKEFNVLDEDNDGDEEELAVVTNYFANKKLSDITNNNLSNNKLSFGSRFVSFFSNHIGKTILFLLAAVALGLTWYLIPALALAMQISLAVCFVLFVAFLIIDEKKNFLPSPKKIFCGLISSEKDDDPDKKRKEKGKEEPKKELKEEPEKKLDEEDKESEISN